MIKLNENLKNKYQTTLNYFKELINENKKKGSLAVVRQYFEDNIGMGEMYLNLLEIRGHWYVINLDLHYVESVEDYAETLLEISSENDFIIEWLENYYDRYLKNR